MSKQIDDLNTELLCFLNPHCTHNSMTHMVPKNITPSLLSDVIKEFLKDFTWLDSRSPSGVDSRDDSRDDASSDEDSDPDLNKQKIINPVFW